MTRPMLVGCMVCGALQPVSPSDALTDSRGWQYDFTEGWICPKCSGPPERREQRRRRGLPKGRLYDKVP